MRISYNRLWKLLIDKNLKKKDLMERCSISSASVAKLTKGDNITTDVLLRICEGLDCDFADIMQVIPDEEPEKKKSNSLVEDDYVSYIKSGSTGSEPI